MFWKDKCQNLVDSPKGRKQNRILCVKAESCIKYATDQTHRPMRYLYLILFFLTAPTLLLATHNRAGEIIVRADGDCDDINNQLRACATIVTYTETGQTEVDREELLISWGDGTTDTIRRAPQ